MEISTNFLSAPLREMSKKLEISTKKLGIKKDKMKYSPFMIPCAIMIIGIPLMFFMALNQNTSQHKNCMYYGCPTGAKNINNKNKHNQMSLDRGFSQNK